MNAAPKPHTGGAARVTDPARAKNTQPANVWQALRRLLNCNKRQLAQRLGVTDRTLREWEAITETGASAGANAERRAADLLQSILRAANAESHAQWRLNLDRLATVGGRK